MKNPKSYIFVGLIILLLAVVISMIVYIVLQLTLFSGNPQRIKSEGPAPSQKDLINEELDDSETAFGSSVDSKIEIPDDGIPLSTLELSDSQKSALSTAGIDADTFVITEVMIRCIEGKLGVSRTNEIMNGAAPGPIESLSILGCVK